MSFDKRKLLLLMAIVVSLLFVLIIGSASAEDPLTPVEELGSNLYFDVTLSQPTGQACASCHDPDFGFVDPDADLPVSEGVFPGKFGGRNSPSAAYAMFSPMLYFDEEEGLWIGGQFWDGRATGEVLGDPLADQALGPFLNPVEMANTSKWLVVRDVANSPYRTLFETVWTGTDLSNWSQLSDVEIDQVYDQIALSIAAFERTELFAPFSSKYDAYLKYCLELGGDPADCAMGVGPRARNAGKAIFSDLEWRGMQLFMGENDNDGRRKNNEGAMCFACHIAEWTPDPGNVVVPEWAPEGLVPPMFTDFTFDNLGVPRNTAYPLDPNSPVDLGLGPVVGDPEENGKFKVMTLRNIGLTEPYAHNGFFLTLKDITHFYNTRDVVVEGWAPPEYPLTVNSDELGNLGLSDADEDALVAFMLTLDDGYMP